MKSCLKKKTLALIKRDLRRWSSLFQRLTKKRDNKRSRIVMRKKLI